MNIQGHIRAMSFNRKREGERERERAEREREQSLFKGKLAKKQRMHMGGIVTPNLSATPQRGRGA